MSPSAQTRRAPSWWRAVAAATALLFAATSPIAAQTIVIDGATVIDLAGPEPVREASIVIEDGRITSIAAHVEAPVNAQRLDGRGRFVLPGLWDMHAHLAALTPVGRAPERYVGHGVLGVRDMGGRLDELTSLRRHVRSGERVGPELVIAGPTLNGQRDADFHRKIATAAEAREAVAELRDADVDFIKIHRALSVEAFDAIAIATRRAGLPFAGHVPLALSWIDAAAAGMRSIEHIQTIFENLQTDPSRLIAEFDVIVERLEGTLGDEIFAAMYANGTYFDPTLIGYAANIDAKGPQVAALRRAAFGHMKRIVARANEAGVAIITGTDVLDRHGEMLLRELELLVETGLTPRQVLAAATINSARAAGRPELGQITVGAPAFLLVVDRNPLDDISHLRELDAVLLRTELFRSGDLRALRQ